MRSLGRFHQIQQGDHTVELAGQSPDEIAWLGRTLSQHMQIRTSIEQTLCIQDRQRHAQLLHQLLGPIAHSLRLALSLHVACMICMVGPTQQPTRGHLPKVTSRSPAQYRANLDSSLAVNDHLIAPRERERLLGSKKAKVATGAVTDEEINRSQDGRHG
jgi:hypothetical protein